MAGKEAPGSCSLTETLSKQLETAENNFVGDLEIKDLQQSRNNSIKKKTNLNGKKVNNDFTCSCLPPILVWYRVA